MCSFNTKKNASFLIFFLTLINYCSYSENMGSANFSPLKFKATCGNVMLSHFFFSHHCSNLLYFGRDLYMSFPQICSYLR